jgi:hypothetical protein
MLTPVHIVAQEEIVYVRNVAGRGGRPILVEKPHEVAKLPVQVAKEFDWGVQLQDAGLLLKVLLCLFTQLGCKGKRRCE